MNLRKLNEEVGYILNEGAGAAVTFHFTSDREYRADVDYTIDGLEVKVENLIISDYYYDDRVYDGGKFVFDEQELKEAFVEGHNEWFGDADSPITIDDVKTIKITGIEEIPNLSCSWGWSRSPIPEAMIISDSSNGYLAEIEVEVNDDGYYHTIMVDGKYIPSDEVIVAYNNLGEEDLDEAVEETVLGKTKTKQQAINKIYKIKHDGIYNDEGWAEVHRIVHEIEELGGEVDLRPANNSTHVSGYPNDGSMKEKTYDITITFTNALDKEIVIRGEIVCSGCGSVEDPLSKYDVVMMLG